MHSPARPAPVLDRQPAVGSPARLDRLPPQAFFLVSAVFHYLGPSLAVLLFARVGVLGITWLRIVTAAAVFAVWRRPWRMALRLDRRGRCVLVAFGGVLAAMNTLFYLAVDRLPLATVGAIEFLGIVLLAALGARTGRNAAALALAVAGVATITDIRIAGRPLGFAFAFGNCALFMLYVVLGHKIANTGPGRAEAPGRADVPGGAEVPGGAKVPGGAEVPGGAAASAAAVGRDMMSGIDQLGAAMLIAALAITPFGLGPAVRTLASPLLLLAGAGVGVCSSVIPYVTDQLAMARLPRATFALMLALLPAFATLIGAVVLGQIPTVSELAGIALVMAGIAIHQVPAAGTRAAELNRQRQPAS
jgi:inner membrane transporter RhtA